MLTPFPIGKAHTPADCAIEHEEAGEDLGRDWTIEREVFCRLCAHWFSAGPQPEEVLQRVFAATADRRPDLLAGLPRRGIILAAEESDRGRRWRLAALFSGHGEDWRARYRAIVSTLRIAFSDAGAPAIVRVTLNEALSVGPDGGEPIEAGETLSRVLETLFRAGSAPRAVAQQAFALTGWLYRDAQLNMSFEELGALFDEERATQSARSKVYVEGMLKRAGARGFKAGWQKPATACAAFAASAKGNNNRQRGRRGHSISANKTKPKNNS